MKVSVFSRKKIEAILDDKSFQKDTFNNVSIISFYDPPSRRTGEVFAPVDYSGKIDRVFTVALHDIDIEILEDYDLDFDTYFPEVDELAAFIIKAIEDGNDIICQCEYGQSRSAGCAAAIKEYINHTGIDIFSDYKYYPNQLVYNKVLAALKNKTPYVSRHYQDIVVSFDEYELQFHAWEHHNVLLYLLCHGKNCDRYDELLYQAAQDYQFIGSFIYKSYGDSLKRESAQYYYDKLFNAYHETIEEMAEQLYMVVGDEVSLEFAAQIHQLYHFCAMCICPFLADHEVWWVDTYEMIIEYALDHREEILSNNYTELPTELRKEIYATKRLVYSF